MTNIELHAYIAQYTQQHPNATGYEISAALEQHQVNKFHTAAVLRHMTRAGVLERTADSSDGRIFFRYTIKPKGNTLTTFVTNAQRLGTHGDEDIQILTPDGDLVDVPA